MTPYLYVVVAYAPADVDDDTNKDEFYDGLQEVINRIPRDSVIVLGGDLNAQCNGG